MEENKLSMKQPQMEASPLQAALHHREYAARLIRAVALAERLTLRLRGPQCTWANAHVHGMLLSTGPVKLNLLYADPSSLSIIQHRQETVLSTPFYFGWSNPLNITVGNIKN